MTRLRQQMNRVQAMEKRAGDEEPVPMFYFAASKADADAKMREWDERYGDRADKPVFIFRWQDGEADLA